MTSSPIHALRRLRRNHAVEHATVHVLSERRPGISLAGRSDSRGFVLYGAVEGDQVRAAVEEALRRLGAEPGLAVHPFCGTNLVVAAVLSAAASLIALRSTRAEPHRGRSLDIVARLLLAGTISAAASQPIGPMVQRHLSTLPDVEGITIRRIALRGHGRYRLHRIELAHPPADRARACPRCRGVDRDR